MHTLGEQHWYDTWHQRVSAVLACWQDEDGEEGVRGIAWLGLSTWNLDRMSKCFFMSVPNTILTQVERSTSSSSDLKKDTCKPHRFITDTQIDRNITHTGLQTNH